MIIRKTNWPFKIVLLAILFTFTACYSPHRIYVADTDPDGWDRELPVSVIYSNADTLTPQNIYLLFRHTSSFPYDRLTCVIEILSPTGSVSVDTVAMKSQDEDRRLDLNYDMEQPYRTETVFNEVGNYTFTFLPLMLEHTITGVSAVGIRIF